MNEKEFIKKLVKNIKKNYNLENKFISTEYKVWASDIITSLNNAESTNHGNITTYNCTLDIRLYNQHIVEYFIIEHSLINNKMWFRY